MMRCGVALRSILLVCGGRTFNDGDFLWFMLDELQRGYAFSDLVHGAAAGADTLADAWGRARGIAVHPRPARWDKHGSAAGVIRNEEMLQEFGPYIKYVVAFPGGGSGTADMIRRASQAGLEVLCLNPHIPALHARARTRKAP